jgi:hypothetical protein
MASYGSIYPTYGGGYGGCNHNYPVNYHSHGSLLGTAIGGLITGDYSGYHYAPNPIYPSFPMMGGYGMGYGGYSGGFGMGYGGGYGMGMGYGGYGYGLGSVPYGGFFWGSRPNIPSCTGHFNNYRSYNRSGQNREVNQPLHPKAVTAVTVGIPALTGVEHKPIAYKSPKVIAQASLFRF